MAQMLTRWLPLLLLLLGPLARGAELPAVLFAGNVRGELPGCACSRAPPAGLARRTTLLHRQQAKGPLAVVEAGDALFFDVGPPDAAAQRRAVYFLALLKRLGTAALVPGPHDLAGGAAFLKREAAKAKVPVISANLTAKGARLFPGSVVVRVGTVRAALVGVSAEGPGPGGAVGAPALAAVEQELKRLAPHDVSLVFAAGGFSQAEALAHALEGRVAAVVSAGELTGLPAPQQLGTTWLVAAAPHGQSLGRLTLLDTEVKLDWLPLGLEVMEDDLVKAEVSALKPPGIYR